MKNLSLVTALLLLLAACNNSGTNEEKLKEEIKKELRKEMEQKSETKEKTDQTVKETKQPKETSPDYAAPSQTREPQKVNFDAEMLKNLTLYGNNNVRRFKEDKLVTYSLTDGSQKRAVSYDTGSDDPILKNAVEVSGNKMTIKVHEDFAIGGVLEIKKAECKRGHKTGFRYTFKVTWRAEPGFNDTGCAFHSKEEYQIVAKVQSMAAGTGGTFYSFTDNKGKSYSFYADKRGINLSDHFPELSPMSNDNPYKNKKYRLFYKFIELEDHRGYRVEPIVTYIEEMEEAKNEQNQETNTGDFEWEGTYKYKGQTVTFKPDGTIDATGDFPYNRYRVIEKNTCGIDVIALIKMGIVEFHYKRNGNEIELYHLDMGDCKVKELFAVLEKQ